ncbi:hypothetical protein BJV82DRAFT_585759 [Fennellomyces sp. T-0311]|nr:hypothetical protein BJV82DRAFT_585759 [Fennellomyces sp. T-0311]
MLCTIRYSISRSLQKVLIPGLLLSLSTFFMMLDKLLWVTSLLTLLIQLALGAPPPSRMFAGCVSLDLRIYCYGGSYVELSSDNSFNSLSDFYYIDAAETFTVSRSDSLWVQVKANSTLQPDPNSMFGIVALPQYHTIVITGGAGNIYANKSLINPTIGYDVQNNEWIALSGNSGLQSYAAGTAASPDGKVYVFGGISDASTGELEQTDIRNMKVLDFQANQWSMVQLPDQFYSYAWHAASMGNDGKTIYYLGGQIEGHFTLNNGSRVYGANDNTFDQVITYDTQALQWTILNATGVTIPTGRMWHATAAKPSSDLIVLYGGRDTSSDFTVPADFCWSLNTKTLVWTQINLDPSAGAGPRFGHSLAFPENSSMLFVMFGVDNGFHQRTDFQVLDTDTWTWIDRYVGPGRNSTGSDNVPPEEYDETSSELSGGAIAGIVVGAIAGAGLIVAAGIFFFIRRQKQQTQSEPEKKTGYYPPVANNNQSPPVSPNTWQIPLPQQATPPPPLSSSSYYVQQYPGPPPNISAGESSSRPSSSQPATVYHELPNVYTPRLRLEPVKPDSGN